MGGHRGVLAAAVGQGWSILQPTIPIPLSVRAHAEGLLDQPRPAIAGLLLSATQLTVINQLCTFWRTGGAAPQRAIRTGGAKRLRINSNVNHFCWLARGEDGWRRLPPP